MKLADVIIEALVTKIHYHRMQVQSVQEVQRKSYNLVKPLKTLHFKTKFESKTTVYGTHEEVHIS